MRVMGMVSGMDIEQMVTDLMQAERVPRDRYEQEQTFKGWQVEAYRELNTQVSSFDDKVFDNLLTPSSFLSRTGSSSNSDMVSVTSSSGTGHSQYTISGVEQLARAATTHSTDAISVENNGFGASQSLGDIDSLEWKKGTVQTDIVRGDGKTTSFSFGEGDDMNREHPMIVRVDGKTYEIVMDEDPSEGQVYLEPDEQVLTFTEPVANGTRVEVEYVDNDTDGRFMFAGMKTYSNEGGPVRHEDFITEEDSLQNALNTFNNSEIGINAFYDEYTDQVSVSRTETGIFYQAGEGNSEMTFEGDFFTDFLKLDNNLDQGALNAEFTVNGMRTERQSNTFSIGNLTVTLEDEFEQEVMVSSSIHTDLIVENIQEFVDTYNELVEKVHGQLMETRNRDYPPLTDQQRNELSEYEAELWDEQAQRGLLSQDRQLGNFMSQIRLNLYATVDVEGSDINHLSDLGITTSNDFRENGKLNIDEVKLRSVVEGDPEGAFKLFSQAEDGIAQNLRATLSHMGEAISQQAGGSNGRSQPHQFVIGREMNQLEDRMKDFDRRLDEKENRYYRQFSQMEQAIARANEQMGMLMNFMSGGNHMM
ncbi:flagellar hook-associated protein 2 [Geomicrobium halophilum]|uniref:Flagellar hook-associated protein 2 n=1 Tax=Geomicrobium halophilum TaxID=549000 RepID=A0A841PNN7_9BACL|nr:flagellar filament capping protein FliD [Geomicrobium halophilum]MBB6450369.1 flagellar hook-associated protein 2 [Geomicrobium halophilum]